MPKGSPELTQARREEIINACEKLYQTMSFKEITIKEIGNVTSFTRTSIYNYFQTKEEIFLALLQREYELWIADLKQILAENAALTKDGFADKLAHSLEKRSQLLKIMSMNHYDMETGSRPEHLAAFKVAYGESIRTVEGCLDKYFPDTKLGKSDLTVSRICMGCMGFGNAATGQHSWTVDEAQTRETSGTGWRSSPMWTARPRRWSWS